MLLLVQVCIILPEITIAATTERLCFNPTAGEAFDASLNTMEQATCVSCKPFEAVDSMGDCAKLGTGPNKICKTWMTQDPDVDGGNCKLANTGRGVACSDEGSRLATLDGRTFWGCINSANHAGSENCDAVAVQELDASPKWFNLVSGACELDPLVRGVVCG